MFMVKTGNTVALSGGFPLIIVRYPYTRYDDTKTQYLNQFAVKMLTDVKTGIAQMEWQNWMGPVLAYCPQIDGENARHFNRFDFKVISKPDHFGFND